MITNYYVAGGTVFVWDVTTRRAVHKFVDNGMQPASSMDISPDGRWVAFGYVAVVAVAVVVVFLLLLLKLLRLC